VSSSWPTKVLGDVCDVDKCQGLWRDLPYVGLEDIEPQTARFIGSATPIAVKSATFRFTPEHVLYGRLRPYLNKVMLPDFVGHCSTEIFPFKPRPELRREFLKYWFLTDETVERIDATSTGTRMPRANIGQVVGFELPLPSLDEQQRTVALLDEAFEGIATAAANAEQNLRDSRAVFESQLGAIFTQHGDEWEKRVSLSALLSVQPRNGWSPPAVYQTGAGVPVLTLSSVTGFQYDGSRTKLTSAPTSDDAHYWLRAGELLITRANTPRLVGHVAVYDGRPARAICPDLIMKMTVDPAKALTRFVYYYLRSPEARGYLMSRAQGANPTMTKIGKSVVQDILVPQPTLTQQHAVVTLLDRLGDETRRLESVYLRKLAALDELKKSLLHEAFSGNL
jgi:type I restriction enzyme S subunit